MSQQKNNKISTVVLWICMIISLGSFYFYYNGLIKHPENMNTMETSLLLNWLYILFCVCIISSLSFSLYHLVRLWKENKRLNFQPLIGVIFFIFLLLTSFFFGSGESLNIAGYNGEDNIFIWLKITDMWIYSIYTLLIVCIIAVIAGIIWSYIKKAQ